MALDNEHHLEGTLTEPNLLRIYLYDSRTQPLAPDAVREVRGSWNLGELPEPDGKPLKAAMGAPALEAVVDEKPVFPLTITVLLDFSGSKAPQGKPELFNFTFHNYSKGLGPNGNPVPDHSGHKAE